MCGIVGFTGEHQAAPILLDGLSRLEYRGYDSAGLAVRDGEKQPEVIRAKGRLKVLAEKTDNGAAVLGTCGIGHTRWGILRDYLSVFPSCFDLPLKNCLSRLLSIMVLFCAFLRISLS